jgi:hypothetical protein
MGDESKDNELKHGNYDPLHATRKPSTAEEVDEQPSDVAQMPKPGEIEPPREETKRR